MKTVFFKISEATVNKNRTVETDIISKNEMNQKSHRLSGHPLKLFFLSTVLWVFTLSYVNAQLFLGGGVGMDYTGGTIPTTWGREYKTTGITYSISPKIGYYLNDNWGIGIQINYLGSHRTYKGTEDEPGYRRYENEDKTNSSGWGVEPLVRYKLAEVRGFSLFLDASVAISNSVTNSKYNYSVFYYSSGYNNYSESEEYSTSAFSYGIGMIPVLSYGISERLSVEASCDFLRLGFKKTELETERDDKKSNGDKIDFGFGLNSPSTSVVAFDFVTEEIVMVPLSILKIGFVLKF